MESTANRFPFNTLPFEMKEKVLEKVNPKDSMKLLEVNKELRTYMLHRGPLYKRFEKIEYCFTRDSLEIIYSLGGQSSNIVFDIDYDDDVWFTGFEQPDDGSYPSEKSFQLHLPRSTSAHFRFLDIILPAKTMRIHLSEWTLLYSRPSLDFLRPTISLRDLIPKCRFLHELSFDMDPFEPFEEFDHSKLFEDLLQIFSPRIMDLFGCSYKDAYVSNPTEYLLRLKSMLVDCREVNIDLQNGELLFEALRQCNVAKISMHFADDEIKLFMKHFEMLAVCGIPSRNSQAQVTYQIYAPLPDDVSYYEYDDKYSNDFGYFDVTEFLEHIYLDVPSVHRLSSDTEDERRYQELFREVSAANNLECDLENLRIYETTSAQRCIFFVYYCKDYVYLIPHYA